MNDNKKCVECGNEVDILSQFPKTGATSDSIVCQGCYERERFANRFAVCHECGDNVDLFTAFTKYQACGKCTRKAHRKAIATK